MWGSVFALDCCLFGAHPPEEPPSPTWATLGMFPTSLSLDPILSCSQPSSLARIRVDKLGAPTKLRVPPPTLYPWDAWSTPAWHCPLLQSLIGPGCCSACSAGSWHWAVASVPLVPFPAPSPFPHAWAPLSPISRQQPLSWLLALGFCSLSCSFV